MKKLSINIRASQTVYYNQTVEMTKEEWEEFKNSSEHELENAQGHLSGWLDLGNVHDGGDFSDVEACVVDKFTGKPKTPRDELS